MRNEGSRESDTDAAADGREIGWGISAEDRQEDAFLRRMLFFVLVCVVGCMGAWFVMTTVTGPGPGGPMQRSLIVNGTSEGVPAFTVELLRFAATRDNDAVAQELVSRPEIRKAAGDLEFCLLPVADGRRALCSGRFADRRAADAALERFQEYTERSTGGFPDAAVMSLSD